MHEASTSYQEQAEVIDGKVTTPTTDDPPNKACERCNVMVLSWVDEIAQKALFIRKCIGVMELFGRETVERFKSRTTIAVVTIDVEDFDGGQGL
ncbi:hypothetical protein CR513_19662, partial [Mucuna pruriens]